MSWNASSIIDIVDIIKEFSYRLIVYYAWYWISYNINKIWDINREAMHW